MTSVSTADFAVVGGGIAGVTCVQQLCLLNPGKCVRLVSASPVLKVVADVVKITKYIEEFSVSETAGSVLESQFTNLKVVFARVENWDAMAKTLHLSTGESLRYGKLCLCCGAIPNRVFNVPGVLVIRDTETVDKLRERLARAETIAVIGNGGIATELVHKLRNCRVHWLIRNESISATFVDAGAAKFLLESATPADASAETDCPVYKRLRYTVSESGEKKVEFGTALGPDWAENHDLFGGGGVDKSISIEYNVEVESVSWLAEQAKYDVRLSSGKTLRVDLVVSATGVVPNPGCFGQNLRLANDGGILVNDNFETSCRDVYAAGDVCSLPPSEELWIQMRLWTQARQMGDAAARSMSGPDQLIPPYFEVFTHATHFFGFKVVLIGLFNGQKLESGGYEVLLRVTPNQEYIKLILKDGRLKGAILVGETDLEEVIENLHYSQLDITDLKDSLLDPDIDLEDYFD
ncbi:pyridine nucleotide-disulfide oxidoreductase domain-containing protein 1-like [Tropilaelaps mercedesae]|uniref:Pyridine nucleotide-disulfide oxidoreductase domain-containing protein 1 n=1 Tax=Tropilaelaps mercedesae TaxID=418985 RepID=A0A1V9Y0G8_9ACAR|nr:pyridine nucleotide-disulfide oxidoreductase domain-containing protein 1-like [Tropilaelaps mercedesae]